MGRRPLGDFSEGQERVLPGDLLDSRELGEKQRRGKTLERRRRAAGKEKSEGEGGGLLGQKGIGEFRAAAGSRKGAGNQFWEEGSRV